MKRAGIALAVVAAAGLVAAVAWFTGPDVRQRQRRVLAQGDREARRAVLREIAAANDLELLPEVAQLWDTVMRSEGFLRTKYKPGSLQPDIHAVFEAAGRPGARVLIDLAADPRRYVSHLVAAGVAMGGRHSAEVGSGPRGVEIRAYRFQVGTLQLRIPTDAERDGAARTRVLQDWRRSADG